VPTDPSAIGDMSKIDSKTGGDSYLFNQTGSFTANFKHKVETGPMRTA